MISSYTKYCNLFTCDGVVNNILIFEQILWCMKYCKKVQICLTGTSIFKMLYLVRLFMKWNEMEYYEFVYQVLEEEKSLFFVWWFCCFFLLNAGLFLCYENFKIFCLFCLTNFDFYVVYTTSTKGLRIDN